MIRRLPVAVTALLGLGWAQDAGPGDDLLPRLRGRVSADLNRLPDFVCHQSVERLGRFGSERPWERVDTLQLEVGMSGNREMYSWAGSRQFQEQQLSELIGKGMIGTGHFALLARHVFVPGAATFRYKGIVEIEGRLAHEWAFDVPEEKSRYRLRTGGGEAAVSFQGAVWADPESLSLVRLEVAAYDIPEKVALAEATNVIRYARVRIGEIEQLLPVSSELTLVAMDGNESHNRLKLGDCRQFRGEAVLTFAGEEAQPVEAAAAERAGPVRLPARAVLELDLAEPLQPGKVTVGEWVRVVIAKPVVDGQNVVVPQGAEATARLVRLPAKVPLRS